MPPPPGVWHRADPKIGKLVEKRIEQQLAANQASLTKMAEALTREAAARADGSGSRSTCRGATSKSPSRKTATSSAARTRCSTWIARCRMVLGFARRDQGEILVRDRSHRARSTRSEPATRRGCSALGVERTALVAAEGTPRRTGDWIIVARRDPSGHHLRDRPPHRQSLRDIRARLGAESRRSACCVIALAFIGIVPISHRMTQHLCDADARRAAARRRRFLGRGCRSDLGDEFGALAARLQPDGGGSRAPSSRSAVEQERLRRELELSRQIQTEMLPRGAAAAPGPAEIGASRFRRAKSAGDFFNYFALPDGRLALLVGDVSGKGVSAALLMANIQATLRARLPHETDLARLADRLDRELDQNTPGSVYLTLFLGILERTAGSCAT